MQHLALVTTFLRCRCQRFCFTSVSDEILCFQYMLAFYILQNGHLLNSYLVEFLETLALRQTFVDKDRIQVLHITQTNQLIDRCVVAD